MHGYSKIRFKHFSTLALFNNTLKLHKHTYKASHLHLCSFPISLYRIQFLYIYISYAFCHPQKRQTRQYVHIQLVSRINHAHVIESIQYRQRASCSQLIINYYVKIMFVFTKLYM